jgi:hypothetical protein
MTKIIFLKFKLFCNETKNGDSVNIVGNIKELGNWDLKNSIELRTTYCDYPIWESKEIPIETSQEKDTIEFEYKYFIKSAENRIIWEKYKGNRHLEIDIHNANKESIFIVNGEYFNDIEKNSFIVIQTREQLNEEHLKTLETEENLENSINNSVEDNESENKNSNKSPSANICVGKEFNIDKYLDELTLMIQELKEDTNSAKEKLTHLFNSFKGKKDFDKELLVLIFIHFLKTGQFKYLDGLPEFSEHHYHFDPILARALCTYLATNMNEENSLLVRSLLRYIPSCADSKTFEISHKDIL